MFRRLKKKLPSQDSVNDHPILSSISHHLLNEHLWLFNRHTVARAFFVGIFSAFIPLPIETPLAALLAYLLGANMPLSLALVWISNPLTWIPMYTPGYLVGCALLRVEHLPLAIIKTPADFQHLLTGEHFSALLLGCAVLGITFATISYFVVTGLWRYMVRTHWNKRKDLRDKKNAANTRSDTDQ